MAGTARGAGANAATCFGGRGVIFGGAGAASFGGGGRSDRGAISWRRGKSSTTTGTEVLRGGGLVAQ